MGFDGLTDVEDVLAGVDAVLDWLRFLEVRPGRFDALRRDVDDFVRAHQQEVVGKYVDPEEFRIAMFSLIEAMDLYRIYRAFHGRETAALIERLDKAVSGPRAGAPEPDEKRSRGRNTLAELRWAALLLANGHTVSIEHRPDAITACPTLLSRKRGQPALTWEVKRPQSAAGLEKVIRRGAQQVREATEGREIFAHYDVQGGCPVIVLDHVIAKSLPPFDSANEARGMVAAAIRVWATEHRNVIMKARKDGVAGVVLYWRPLVFLPNASGTRIPVGCEQLVFFQVRPVIHGIGERSYVEVARDMVGGLEHWPAE